MSSSSSKSSGRNTPINNTLSQFDRGPVRIRDHFSTLTQSEIITLQLLFFALLEVLASNLTNNKTNETRLLFQLVLQLLTNSKILSKSMSLSAISIGKLELAQNYVRILRGTIQTALNIIQKPSATKDGSTIISVLQREYAKLSLLTPLPPSNISIDIPQPDISLQIPLPLVMNGTVATNDFDNVVVFRYVQDFYEVGKLGKGSFGTVFRAKNHLDDRMYAIKKIVFSENTDRTRRQAKCALREVRVLASLSHPNIVQYHCAWIELVPFETTAHRTKSSSSSSTPQTKKKPLRQVDRFDSRDALIAFEEVPSTLPEHHNEEKSPAKSSSTSQEDDEDGSENSDFGTNGKNSNSKIHSKSHSDGDHYLSSTSRITDSHSRTTENVSNKQLIPVYARNQSIPATAQSKYIDSKIVLFIQMQLCDTTLHTWLRYRDQSILVEPSDETEKAFDKTKQISHTLNELGQRQCWHIFKQLLTAVEYLHSQSFVHRDIKPRNIFLSYDKKDISSVHVKLGDFGLATLLDSEITPESSEHFQNDESAGVGTALYAPPEQLHSRHCIVTTKSDSYSLGIVLFELFNIFSTDMERCHCLSDLRVHMKVDNAFSQHYPLETTIIEQLVSIESEKRPSVEQILTTYAKDIQQRMRRQQNTTKQMMIDRLQEELRDKDRRIQQLELELERTKL